MQTIDTLIELCQGCVKNQEVVFDAKVLDPINFIIRRHKYPDCQDYEVGHLKKSCAVLLSSLLEDDQDPLSARLASEIVCSRCLAHRLTAAQYDSLDVAGIQRGIVYYYDVYKQVWTPHC